MLFQDAFHPSLQTIFTTQKDSVKYFHVKRSTTSMSPDEEYTINEVFDLPNEEIVHITAHHDESESTSSKKLKLE